MSTENLMIVSATPKKNMPDIGWKEGVDEAVLVQLMSNGKYCIFRRSGVPVKSGYKTYPSLEDMEQDFKLERAPRVN